MNITSSSVANPTVITTSGAHTLTSNRYVQIAGHTGSVPDINGIHKIIVTDTNKLTIPVHVTTGGTGGTLTALPEVATNLLLAMATSEQLEAKVLPAGFPVMMDLFALLLGRGTASGNIQVGTHMECKSKLESEDRMSSTLTADADLSFTIPAEQRWLAIFAFSIAGNEGSVKWQISGGADSTRGGWLGINSDSEPTFGTESSTMVVSADGADANGIGIFAITAGGSDYPCSLKWAHDSSGQATLNQGSTLFLLRMK